RSPHAPGLVTRELAIAPILARGRAPVAGTAAAMERALAANRTSLVSTERVRRDVGLAGARAISDALVDVVRAIERRPAWIIAKGGITSSDVASRGLQMAEARVAGQILPGVPVWIGADGSRWPGLPLVVFPGNVGEEDSLTRAVDLLTARDPERLLRSDDAPRPGRAAR
ncbi:MAG: nucleotide-binding domain containing protein, partial [Candidatus Limnocylindria bacterium]